jgi:hypothetical protein
VGSSRNKQPGPQTSFQEIRRNEQNALTAELEFVIRWAVPEPFSGERANLLALIDVYSNQSGLPGGTGPLA